MRREDLEYWNTVLGETYESDGFYTDRPRVTPLRERTQTYIDLGTGGGDFASDGKWPFAVSFAAAVSFVMSKNLMKNDVMIVCRQEKKIKRERRLQDMWQICRRKCRLRN